VPWRATEKPLTHGKQCFREFNRGGYTYSRAKIGEQVGLWTRLRSEPELRQTVRIR